MSYQKPDLDAVIIHIPHSSLYIPEEYRKYFTVDAYDLEAAHLKMVDRYCDELYLQEGFTNYAVANVSRLFCDMERFRKDEEECMSKYGLGAVYTKLEDGKELRKITKELREEILQNYYDPHHAKLTEMVDRALMKYGRCLILDGHSFYSHFFLRPMKKAEWADFDIGTDKYHTPDPLKDYFKNIITESGFSVSINEPYSGALVPMKYYSNNRAVTSVMLEINRRNYMNIATGEKLDSFDQIKDQVGEWMLKIFEFWRKME